MYRNKLLLEIARESICTVCGNSDGTVVAAHSNQLRDGKGRSIKSHDYRIAAMCYWCHMEYDQGLKYTKAEKTVMFDEAHRKFIGWLFENDKLLVRR